MEHEHFSEQVHILRNRLARLDSRTDLPSEAQRDLIRQALQDLQLAIEEMQVAEEELRAQNESLTAAHEVIEGERRRYRELFELAPDGYIVTDEQGTVLEANQAAAELLGVPEKFLAGKPLAVFVDEEDREGFRGRLSNLARAERIESIEMKFAPRRGETRDLAVRIARVPRLDEEGVELRWLLRDITEAKRARTSIEVLNAELEQRVLERTRELQAANVIKEQLLLAERGARARAQEAERRHRDLVDGLDAVVWEADAQTWRFGFVSRRAEEILGYETELWLAKPDFWFRIIHPEDRERVSQVYRTAATTGKHQRFEFRVYASDDRIIWLRDVVYTVRSPGGQVRQLRGQMVDVTERKKAEEDIKKAKEEAESASRMKDEFLAVLSHELRTPLTPVLMLAADIESRKDLPSGLRENISMIRRNVQLEARLIDDLLDLARIARGKLELQLQDLDAHEVLANVLEICSGDIEAKDLSLKVQIDGRPARIRGDAARLQQVLWNVIKNAIKFTPRGGWIRIDTAIEEKVLRIRVADNGIGIEPAHLLRIFDAFEQGDRAITRHFGGLGLGLAICRALVEAHGGTLTAESDGKDRGSAFIIELGLLEGSPLPGGIAERASRQPLPAAGPLRILVVEDNEDTAYIMERLLTHAGHEVRTAGSYRAALTLAADEAFDVLISDIGLPDGSGIDLMKAIRKGGHLKSHGVHGIALSGFGMDSDRERTREAGFDEHIVKPVDLPRLLEALKRVTAGRPAPPGGMAP